MNNERRKRIKEVIVRLGKIKDDLDEILFDEQEAYDNMTEGLKMSVKGMNSEDSIDTLETAMENLEECIGNLNGIM